MNTVAFRSIVFFLLPFFTPLFASEFTSPAAEGIHVWKVVNAKLHVSETGLKVLAQVDQPRPVLKIADLKKTGEFVVKVSVKVTNPGSIGVAWHLNNEKVKGKRKSVYRKLKPSDKYQEVSLAVPVNGVASNFEIIVPWGDCSIKSIEFSGGGSDLHWDFGAKDRGAVL
ncbi:MAG: hypothetical protein P1V20_15245 [Verrucomicrobiales bacterium]|nr:hypothetical protein [Verrucomicrobiales bacterium]